MDKIGQGSSSQAVLQQPCCLVWFLLVLAPEARTGGKTCPSLSLQAGLLSADPRCVVGSSMQFSAEDFGTKQGHTGGQQLSASFKPGSLMSFGKIVFPSFLASGFLALLCRRCTLLLWE